MEASLRPLSVAQNWQWPVAKHKDVHLARISAGCLVLKVFEPLVGTLHTFYHHVKA